MRKEAEDFVLIKRFHSFIESINFDIPPYYENAVKSDFADLNICPVLGDGQFQIIERITVNKRVLDNKNIRINNINDLKYPPADKVNKYGRANLKQQSVFYGAFHFMTAIKEMKPESGDLITVSKWVLKNKEDKLITCPMFMKQPSGDSLNLYFRKIENDFTNKLKSLDSELSNLYIDIHKFYAECFSKTVDANNNQDYLFTALLADKIFNQYCHGSVDAILYPSIQQNLTVENIAIKKESFDKKYELKETIEKEFIGNDGDNYRFELISKSSTFRHDTIVWNNNLLLPH